MSRRKATAGAGDDTTLSRFVQKAIPQGERQLWIPDTRHPAMRAGRSVFYRKGVKQAGDVPRILTSGHNNGKIGRDVRKGRLRDYWIYVLTLEERATCPRSCGHWQTCYGNNMPFARRIAHGPEMLRRIEQELAMLCAKRKGILLRLHALGDFYSPEYVAFWDGMLRLHPNLSIFGYTAHHPGTEIGDAVGKVIKRAGFGRFAIRFSGWDGALGAITIDKPEEAKAAGAVVCPQQTGGTICCATCALCWQSERPIAFLRH